VCVDLDFEAAATQAVDRLVDLGHSSIGLVGQVETAYAKSNFPPRVRAAFLSRAEERGVTAQVGTSGSKRASRTAAGRTAAAMLDEGVTALVLHCADDAHRGVLTELESRGLRVPDDISVLSLGASFDTAGLPIALDSIPLIPEASCDLAVALALEALGPTAPEPGVRYVAPTYVVHGSVGPSGTSPPGA
jgi:DNA-binding LacI/PurR family transcriptional regulator